MSPAIAANEFIAKLTPEERARLLGELVKICIEEGTIEKPRLVTDEKGLLKAYVINFFPPTTGPAPELTPEERAELQRRIDQRHEAVSQEEFIAEMRRLRKESRGRT